MDGAAQAVRALRASRRAVLSGGLLVSAAPLLAACGSESATGTTGETRELLVGAALELTGGGALVGATHRNGVQIALETINRQGISVNGVRYRLRVEVADNKSDVPTTNALTEKFAEAGAVAVIGGGLAETAVAMSQAAQRAEMPAICLTAADDLVIPVQQRRYVFKLGPNGADVAQRMTTEMQRQAVRRVALLAVEGLHGDSGVSAVATAAPNAGIVLSTVERFSPMTNLAGQVRRIIAGNPDAVVVWALGTAPGDAVRQLRDAGYRGLVLLDPGAGNLGTLLPAVRDAVDGAILINPTVLTGSQLALTSPAGLAQQAFFERYTQLYGIFSGTATYTSDALHILANAVRRGAVGRETIREAVEREPYEGIAGSYVFSAINHGGMDGSALGTFMISRADWSRIS